MSHRGTIGRLMGSVGLNGLALGLLRGWLGPVNFLGFLAPMVLLVLVGLALMLPTAGRIRRFFAGIAASGLCIALAILIAPATIHGTMLERVILPIKARFEPSPPGSGLGSGLARLEFALLCAEFDGLELDFDRWNRETNLTPPWRKFFHRITHQGPSFDSHSTYLQSLLAIPQVILALIGGCLALSLRSRLRLPTLPSHPVRP